MKVALIYDRVNKWGGAERVLLALHELFPKAPLYTSVYNSNSAKWAKEFTIKPSFLQYIPYASQAHEYFAVLMPIAFEQFNFDKYDVVISVSSEAAKGIITKPSTLHIHYSLTPTRYLWSGFFEYFSSKILQVIIQPVIWYLRKWDTIAAQRPDRIVSISEEVKKRVEKYYKRKSLVIYPSVQLVHSSTTKKSTPGDYFLIVSRLVSYKRVDLAVKVCTKLGIPLKIVGTGTHEKYLKTIAGETVEFVGSLTDQELIEYYKGCLGLIFPGVEDFGLTILEAQGFGKPVIAFYGGGAVETIKPGVTGEFFYKQTISALEECILQFSANKYSSEKCIAQAKKFSKKKFQKQFLELINKSMQGKNI